MVEVEWINEAAPSPSAAAPAPVVEAVKPPRPINWWLLIAIALGALLYYQQQDSHPAPQPDDQVVVVDDDKQVEPSPAPVSLRGSHLVFVCEQTGYPAWMDQVMLSVTNEGLQSQGFAGFRRYDDEQKEVEGLVSFAVSKNIPPPFVALVKDLKSMEPLRLVPFVKTPAELQEFLK